MPLEIAGDHPDLAVALQTDLGRAEDVTGRVQGHPDTVYIDRHSIGQFLDADIGAQASLEQRCALRGREIAPASRSRMVGVGMGNDRTADRPRGVDIEIGSPAVQPFLVFSIMGYSFRTRQQFADLAKWMSPHHSEVVACICV